MLYIQYFCSLLRGHFAAIKVTGSSARYRWIATKSSAYLPWQRRSGNTYFGESLIYLFFPVYQEFCHLSVKVMVFEGREVAY